MEMWQNLALEKHSSRRADLFPTGFWACNWKCLVTLLGKTHLWSIRPTRPGKQFSEWDENCTSQSMVLKGGNIFQTDFLIPWPAFLCTSILPIGKLLGLERIPTAPDLLLWVSHSRNSACYISLGFLLEMDKAGKYILFCEGLVQLAFWEDLYEMTGISSCNKLPNG